MSRRRQRLDGSPRKIWRRRERFPHPTSPPPRLVARITIQVPANIGSDSASTRTSEFSAQASPDCYRESPQAGREPALPPTQPPPDLVNAKSARRAYRKIFPCFRQQSGDTCAADRPTPCTHPRPRRVTRAPSPTPTCNDRTAHHRPPHIAHCPHPRAPRPRARAPRFQAFYESRPSPHSEKRSRRYPRNRTVWPPCPSRRAIPRRSTASKQHSTLSFMAVCA